MPTIAPCSLPPQMWQQSPATALTPPPPSPPAAALTSQLHEMALDASPSAPPQPAAVLAAAKTLGSSAFQRAYSRPESTPRYHHHLETAVEGLLHAHARRAHMPAAEADRFFVTLRTNAITTALGEGGSAEVLQPAQLMHVAVRLWTSALTPDCLLLTSCLLPLAY